MYTNLTDSRISEVSIRSLILAHEYASQLYIEESSLNKKKELESHILKLRQLFSANEEESVHLKKTDSLYLFLKMCPWIQEDKITWLMIKDAYVLARIKNNKAVIKALGTTLGHLESYILNGEEREGLIKEILQFPKAVKVFILKYHDSKKYIDELYERRNKQKVETPTFNKNVLTSTTKDNSSQKLPNTPNVKTKAA